MNSFVGVLPSAKAITNSTVGRHAIPRVFQPGDLAGSSCRSSVGMKHAYHVMTLCVSTTTHPEHIIRLLQLDVCTCLLPFESRRQRHQAYLVGCYGDFLSR
jgi:hypothetical protein